MNPENLQLLADFSVTYLSTLKHIEELISQPTQKYKLSFEQFTILKEIAGAEDAITPSDLAYSRAVTKGAISRQLQQLTKLEYVRQVPSKKDRRVSNLELTDLGKEVQENLSHDIIVRWNEWMEIYGTENAKVLLILLEKFNKEILSEALNRKPNLKSSTLSQ
jgi:DNA-binding MarR family transcriptional regulator